MKLTVTSNIQQRITSITQHIRRLPDDIPALAEETVRRSEEAILEIVAFEPPKTQFPYGQFPWTSEKQRRYVLGFVLKGKKYQRTGTRPRAWRVFSITASEGATIIVQNDWDKAKYLHGRFDGVSPQQRFHHIIGWTTANANRERVITILRDSLSTVIGDTLIPALLG